jgi:hypothetical protein
MLNSEYASYQLRCAELAVKPCGFEQWQIATALSEPHYLPYITVRDTVWIHDNRKKTLRTDRPLSSHLDNLVQGLPPHVFG